MLAAAASRYIGDSTLKNFQQCLLDTLARNVTRYRRIVILAAYFVDLVDVYDTGLGLLHIVACRLQKPEKDVLDVLTDIAGFRQAGRIDDAEWDTQHARQRLGKKGLAGPRRPD